MDKKIEDIKKRLQGATSEAWADIDHLEGEGHVSIPSEEAVERAKEYAETNER